MMYEWAFILFFLTSLTAIFAFTGLVTGIVPVAKILFFILLVPTILLLFSSFFEKRKTNLKRLPIDIK